jgi:hypothetical protein
MQELLKNGESFVAAFFKPVYLKKIAQLVYLWVNNVKEHAFVVNAVTEWELEEMSGFWSYSRLLEQGFSWF